jgi:hypothetical protein
MVESRPFSGNVTPVFLNVISARPMQNLVQFLLRDDGKSPCSMMLHVWMSFYRLPFKHLLSKNDPVIMVHTQTDIYIYIPMDPSTFLGSVWGMIWGVICIFSGSVWIHRV